MAACDAIVSLRSPTMGETSGSAIRALSLGKPLVVSDVGWFSELPDDAVLKVPVDEREEDTLRAALEALADPAVRAAMGARARELVEREHRLDRVAEAYAAALEQLAGGAAVEDARAARGRRAPPRRSGSEATPTPPSRRAAARGRSWRLAPLRAGAGARHRRRSSGPSRRGPGWRRSSSSRPGSATRSRGGSSRPWIMVDELIYSELAKSFADAGHFLLRGEHDGAPTGSSTRRCSARRGRSSTASRRRTRRRRRSTRS